MAGDTFGKMFTITTFGESHGLAMGCVVDGCPPGLALTEADIQKDLDRRRPGRSRHVSQRAPDGHRGHRAHVDDADVPGVLGQGRARGPS